MRTAILRGLAAIYARVTGREILIGQCRSDHEDDQQALSVIAFTMLGDYEMAVAKGSPRQTLGEILTGIAGCELAQSRAYSAMGWNPDPTPGEPSHPESTRLSGLLVLVVAAVITGLITGVATGIAVARSEPNAPKAPQQSDPGKPGGHAPNTPKAPPIGSVVCGAPTRNRNEKYLRITTTGQNCGIPSHPPPAQGAA